VGKTSLLTALAAASGHKIARINLSEQTDMMDLLGLDLPVAGGKAGQFAWCANSPCLTLILPLLPFFPLLLSLLLSITLN
jgi:midasin (ATPase involved in ribosome maturation)